MIRVKENEVSIKGSVVDLAEELTFLLIALFKNNFPKDIIMHLISFAEMQAGVSEEESTETALSGIKDCFRSMGDAERMEIVNAMKEVMADDQE